MIDFLDYLYWMLQRRSWNFPGRRAKASDRSEESKVPDVKPRPNRSKIKPHYHYFMMRGGYWNYEHAEPRAAFRVKFVPEHPYKFVSLRCARRGLAK